MATDPVNEFKQTDGAEAIESPEDSIPPSVIPQTLSNQAQPQGSTTSRWKENHGPLLLTVFFAITGFGFLVIWYQQTRFVPPRFPDGEMIQTVEQLEEDSQSILQQENMIAIRIAGAPNDTGTVKAAIHANSATFNSGDQALVSQSLKLQNGEALWVIPVDGLPSEFAVAAYHDENNDQQLTLNRFGIPTERYGFSREARGLTGPPNFLDAIIERPQAGGLLYVFLR